MTVKQFDDNGRIFRWTIRILMAKVESVIISFCNGHLRHWLPFLIIVGRAALRPATHEISSLRLFGGKFLSALWFSIPNGVAVLQLPDVAGVMYLYNVLKRSFVFDGYTHKQAFARKREGKAAGSARLD